MAWYTGCTTPEEKKAREDLVRNNVQFATVLLQILSERAELVERKGLKEDDYANSGWITLQAFRNGKLAEIYDLANLFTYLKGK